MGVYAKQRGDGTKAWYYDFMYNGKRYRSLGGTTKTEALRTLDKARSKVISGDFEFLEHPGNPKFECFAATYLERRNHLKSHRRNVILVNHLKGFFSGKVLMSIKPTDIEDYISFRRKQVANATINRELACLKRMYNLAIKWHEAKKNPVNDVDFLKEPPGRMRFLEVAEAERLLECSNHYLRPIVFTALNTGLRLNEILSLTWDRVYIQNVIDPYLEIIMTKNNKNRNVPLNDDMVQLLESIKKSDSGFVFVGLQGQPLQSVRKPFETALKRAGILDFTFHGLRHTFASHFVMNGGDLLTLKEILGHSSMQMVERYAHLAQAHKRRQVNNLSGHFKFATYLPPEAKLAKSDNP